MHYFSCLQDLVRTKRQESLPKDFAFLLYTFQNTRGNKFTRSFNVLTNVYFAAASMERPGLCLRVAWQVRLKLNQIQEKIEWKMKITRLKQKKIARQKKKDLPILQQTQLGICLHLFFQALAASIQNHFPISWTLSQSLNLTFKISHRTLEAL